jgi:hypothetical protein
MDASRIDERTVARPRDDVAVAAVDHELVIHDPGSDVTHHYGRTAAVVWHCLDGETSVAGIADDVVAVLGVDREAATDDLLRFVRRFARAGLLAGTEQEWPSAAEPELVGGLRVVPPDP